MRSTIVQGEHDRTGYDMNHFPGATQPPFQQVGDRACGFASAALTTFANATKCNKRYPPRYQGKHLARILVEQATGNACVEFKGLASEVTRGMMGLLAKSATENLLVTVSQIRYGEVDRDFGPGPEAAGEEFCRLRQTMEMRDGWSHAYVQRSEMKMPRQGRGI